MAASIAAAIGPNKESSTSASPAATQVPEKKKIEPFSDADWTWLNGNPRTKEIYWDSKFFTPEIRADSNYVSYFNHPTDHSFGGSGEVLRASELRVRHVGVCRGVHYHHSHALLLC